MKRELTDREKAIRERIHETLDIVLDLNGIGERKKEKTGDLPTGFFEFSGHTSSVSVRICETGWSENASYRDFYAYIDFNELTPKWVETIREYAEATVNNDNHEAVLMRNIEEQEAKVARERKALSNMKRNLRKLQKGA